MFKKKILITLFMALVLAMTFGSAQVASAEHPFYPGSIGAPAEYWSPEAIEYNMNVLKHTSLAADWEVKTEGNTMYASTTISFANDSLTAQWTTSLNILAFSQALKSQTVTVETTVDTNTITMTGYKGETATISWKNTGDSTGNFVITTYLSNYLTSDTSLINISQAWDTTGQYTLKPVNDTLNTSLNGLPFKYLYMKIAGATGNDKAVDVEIRVVFRKD